MKKNAEHRGIGEKELSATLNTLERGYFLI
jgi:hypothetical protein